MNDRGQAYSVFRLLIAAIVAVAILAILIPIIMNIFPPGNDISAVTKQLVQKQEGMPGALDTSTEVIFKTGSSLAPSAIAGNTGLTAEQVCLHKGDFIDNEFIKVQGQTIMNVGSSDIQMKVSVICNQTNKILTSINELEIFQTELDFDGTDGICQCPIESDTATQKCCAVMLRYS